MRVSSRYKGPRIHLPLRVGSQPPVGGPQFEVASVRQAAAGSCGVGGVTSTVFKVDAARVDIGCMTLGGFDRGRNWTWGREAPGDSTLRRSCRGAHRKIRFRER